jgi:triacylglycerol lipase
MRNGDLVEYLNMQGYESYAASVDPVGGAWDRACELYAQLTGTVVDYGEVHAALYNHNRFGTDYSNDPLITGWGEQDEDSGIKKVNFMCHSFGGATVRLMSQLMADGSQEEIDKTGSNVSGLFAGGKTGWIYSITTLASPHNGSTVINLTEPFKRLLPAVGSITTVGTPISVRYGIYHYLMSMSKLFKSGLGEDTGVYDITLDGAAELNEMLSPMEEIYYFSFSTDATTSALFSNKRNPDLKLADFVFLPTCLYMGRATGVSPGGIVYDESWYNSDGIVNTISSKAPANEAQKVFDASNITPGIWNIMDTFQGDHASIIGGVARAVDVNPFYLEQISLIDSL